MQARWVPATSQNESMARAESLRASVGDGGLNALYIPVLEHESAELPMQRYAAALPAR